MTNTARNRLMIPGPVEVHPAVLEALSGPVEPHYGPAWVEKYSRITGLLKKVLTPSRMFS